MAKRKAADELEEVEEEEEEEVPEKKGSDDEEEEDDEEAEAAAAADDDSESATDLKEQIMEKLGDGKALRRSPRRQNKPKVVTKPPTAKKRPASGGKGGKGGGKGGRKNNKKTKTVKTEDANKQRQRGSNFDDFEDQRLCRAFISSAKSHKGTAFKKGDFWKKRVAPKFNKLVENEAEPDEHGMVIYTARAPDQLRRRWGTLSARFRKFMACYRRVYAEHKTGFASEDDYINSAVDQFTEENGEAFNHRNCIPHLESWPAFDPHISESEADRRMAELAAQGEAEAAQAKTKANANNTRNPMGATHTRPPGRNSTKLALAMNNSVASSNQERNQALESIAFSQQMLSAGVLHRGKMKSKMKRVELLARFGKQEEAEALLKETEDDERAFEERQEKLRTEREQELSAKKPAPKAAPKPAPKSTPPAVVEQPDRTGSPESSVTGEAAAAKEVSQKEVSQKGTSDDKSDSS